MGEIYQIYERNLADLLSRFGRPSWTTASLLVLKPSISQPSKRRFTTKQERCSYFPRKQQVESSREPRPSSGTSSKSHTLRRRWNWIRPKAVEATPVANENLPQILKNARKKSCAWSSNCDLYGISFGPFIEGEIRSYIRNPKRPKSYIQQPL